MTISLQKQFNSLEELRRIEFENERRKNLIRLAVLRVVSLTAKTKKSKKSNTSTGPQIDTDGDYEGIRSTERNHEYELVISKLKQLYSTQERIQESKIEALKEEVDKLKLELKWKASTSKYELSKFNPGTKIGLSQFKSSYLNSNPLPSEYLSPPSKSIFSPKDPIDSILSPLKITKSKNPLLTKKHVKGDIFNNATNELSNILNRSHESPYSPRKSPSRLSFVKNFDKSNDSVQTTPTKSKKAATDYKSPPFIHSTANNLEVSDDDDDDAFASAHMSISSDTSENGTKKKKRRLQILTSQASKIQIANILPKDKSEGLHLEDEDVNSLNYYHDDNFKDDSFTGSVKRPAEEAVTNPVKKKKTNVFKIE